MHRIILSTEHGYVTEEARPWRAAYSEDRFRAQRFETESDALIRAAALGLKGEDVDTETYAVA